MRIIESVAEFRKTRRRIKGRVGFVATMGYLHEGHLALVRAARKECDYLIASIYVNPSQFSAGEDLSSYPRDMEKDLTLLKYSGVDLVFTPTDERMYPEGFNTWVKVESLDQRLESESRPHFFRGVATIVAKLFNIVQPDSAYFGRKDAQQLLIISRMVKELNIPTQIVPVDTVREADGLAMSSRNVYLNPEERQAARVIWQSLTAAAEAFIGGEVKTDALRKIILDLIKAQPLAKVDYVSIADVGTLEELEVVETQALVSLAVIFGKTRLIDNTTIG